MTLLFYSGMKAAGCQDGSPERDNPETIAISGTSVKFCWQYIDQDA